MTTKIDYCKRTMTQNIGVVFVLRGNKKMTLMYWIDRSCQMQIIRNYWTLIKFKLRGSGPSSSHFNRFNLWRFLSQDYAIKLVESMPWRSQAYFIKLLIMEMTGKLNNKASRFISCNMCVFFFQSYPK